MYGSGPAYILNGYGYWYLCSTVNCAPSANPDLPYQYIVTSVFNKAPVVYQDGVVLPPVGGSLVVTTQSILTSSPCSSSPTASPTTSSATCADLTGETLPFASTNGTYNIVNGWFTGTATVSVGQGQYCSYPVYAATADAAEWTVGYPPTSDWTSAAASGELWVFQDRWVFINADGNQELNSLTSNFYGNPPSSMGEIYVSRNKGITWSPIMHGPSHLYTATYVTPSLLIGVFLDGALRGSNDDGATWWPVQFSFFQNGIASNTTFVYGENTSAMLIPLPNGMGFVILVYGFKAMQFNFSVNNNQVTYLGAVNPPSSFDGGFSFFAPEGSVCGYNFSSPSSSVWVLDNQYNFSSLTVSGPLPRTSTPNGFQKNPASIEGV